MYVNYMPAYIISNENQRWATNAVPNVKSVLTVAGSGDQALFYTLSGAKTVNTFDITYNARIIQDIKFAAIQHINRQEYKDLLEKIYRTKNTNVISILQSYNLWDFLTSQSREALTQKKSLVPFSCGLNIHRYPENIPTDDEYTVLKNTLKEPFDFAWSDLLALPLRLHTTYDLINISNIFDYVYDGDVQVKILDELSEHLNVGGRIVYLPQISRRDYEKLERPKIAFEKVIFGKNRAKMVVFQKTK